MAAKVTPYDPTPHGEQATELEPAAKYPAGQAVSFTNPKPPQKNPGSQAVHTVAFVHVENVPFRHGVGDDIFAVGQKLPGGQEMGTMTGEVNGQNEPGGHGIWNTFEDPRGQKEPGTAGHST